MLVSLLAVPALAESNTQPATVETSASDWIIKLDSGWASFNSFSSVDRFLGDAESRRFGDLDRTIVASFEGETSASDAIARLASHPGVEFVEPDIIYEYQDEFIPDDPGFEDQSWTRTVNLPDAWSVSSGDPETVVAVVDSGIRADHPDLQGKVVEGRNFAEDAPDESDTTDVLGHGTGVAGIVAATGDNGVGVAGSAMNVKLMPLKVGNDNGAPVSQIAQAVEHAVDNGADVINLSLGSETESARLRQSLDYAEQNDVIAVAASGNEPDTPTFPGSWSTTISVGATTLDGSEMAQFSSRVSVTDLVAPGENVLSTYWTQQDGNTYAYLAGTSFATPIVSGVAALLDSVNPDLDVHQIRGIMRETAQLNFAEGTQGAGAGLVDASAAVRRAMVPAYAETWLPEDEPVMSYQAQRTWLWGPHAFDLRTEPYADTENGQRLVAYYDKARMEINDPYGDRDSEWYVANGLLVNELISGMMQVGDGAFEQREPAEEPVAGDPDAAQGPTYASFNGLTGAPPLDEGATIVQTVDRAGDVGQDEGVAEYGVTAEEYIPETEHRIASVFWDYLNSSGILRQQGQYIQGQIFTPTFFATGFPVTEAYWADVVVAGEEQDVLVQCFERRCLTYTPANDQGWRVEMGNVGRHYYQWRYGTYPAGPSDFDPSAYAMDQLR